jgi:hypothetical protein
VIERAELTIGDPGQPMLFGSGNRVMGSCDITWDRGRGCWLATIVPTEDATPIQAWSVRKTAAVLAAFAIWLGTDGYVVEAIHAADAATSIGMAGVRKESK